MITTNNEKVSRTPIISNLKVWRYLSTKSKCWEKFITTREDRKKKMF